MSNHKNIKKDKVGVRLPEQWKKWRLFYVHIIP